MEDLISALERQHEHLQKQHGVKLIRQGKAFIDYIESDPRLALIIADFIESINELVNNLHKYDASLTPELQMMRNELAVKAPLHNDSEMKRPKPSSSSSEYEGSLAFFDKVLKGKDKKRGVLLNTSPLDDNTTFRLLADLLIGKIDNAMHGYNPKTHTINEELKQPELQQLKQRILELKAKHDYEYRKFLDNKFTMPGPAWLNLKRTYEEANPVPRAYSELSPEEQNRLFERAIQGHGYLLRKVLYHPFSTLKAEEEQRVEAIAQFISECCEQIFQALMLSIGGVRSNLALIRRYKVRCEWHQRKALRESALNSRTPEDDLADTLSLWLYDQGLNPLTRSLTGGLSPDLLDIAAKFSTYVEAKQYKVARKSLVTKGIAQMFDTMARLHGSLYEVKEGFFVVYRLDGSLFVLPDVIRAQTWTIYPIVIDLANPDTTGSRQKNQPLVVDEEEILNSTDLSNVRSK